MTSCHVIIVVRVSQRRNQGDSGPRLGIWGGREGDIRQSPVGARPSYVKELLSYRFMIAIPFCLKIGQGETKSMLPHVPLFIKWIVSSKLMNINV